MQARDILKHLLIKTAANRRTSQKVVDSDAVLGKLAKLHQTKKNPQ